MVFTSFEYLLLFLPIACLLMAGLTRLPLEAWGGARQALIIVLSLIFYATWKIDYLWLLLGSIIFNFSFGWLIHQNKGVSQKLILGFAVAVNLGALGYFKYTNFVVDSINYLAGTNFFIEKIVLPLAISFFTFQQIAWLVDQYRNDAPKCTFIAYSSAVTFFPHLIAGPIVHYHDLLPQFQAKNAFQASAEQTLNGLFLISFGVFKKIVIADTLAPTVTQFFDKTEVLNAYQAWLGTFGYTMQLYFDFSGYCDIAIGSALLLGITLPLNFDLPYKSRNIQEFWQKWHITLGDFFARYLYIPLGGSRRGSIRTLVNLFIVMFLSGIWHGAGVGFIIWGTLHGLAMVIHRACRFLNLKTLPRRLSVFVTFLFISLAWIPFRAESWEKTEKVITGLFNLEGVPVPSFIYRILPIEPEQEALSFVKILEMEHDDFRVFAITLIFAFLIVFLVPRCQVIYDRIINRGNSWKAYGLIILSAFLLFVSLVKMVVVPYSEFIYFNF